MLGRREGDDRVRPRAAVPGALAREAAGAARSAVGREPAEARYLLYVLAHGGDRGKLGRIVGKREDVVLMHKAGWVDAARHDAGLVVWPGGVFVAVVMTYRHGDAGVRSDVLAGQVAAATLHRFRG